MRPHAAGLNVILDWVPGHFPSDEFSLAEFDGTHLYEHSDPREGYHQDWNTLIYNYGRREVSNYLVGNALYWMERFGIDALRVDAVASMIYRDYSRKEGEWIPNEFGGRENLEAIEFLRNTNRIIGEQVPGAVSMAEESTDFAGVTRPTGNGRPGVLVQVEPGLDARHAGLHEAGPGVPPVSSRQADLWYVVQPYRKLCSAAVAR